MSNLSFMVILLTYKYCVHLYIFSLLCITITYYIHNKYQTKNYVLLFIVIIEVILSFIPSIRLYIIVSFLFNCLLYMLGALKNM